MPERLTQVLAFIKNYQDEHGYCPSIAIIGGAFGNTKQWASLCITALQKEGFIERHKGYRSLRITDKGLALWRDEITNSKTISSILRKKD
jgi:SOS-response transcriptional repressor LexA